MAGYVTFQAAHDLGSVEAFGSSPRHVGAGLFMAAHAGENDPIQSGVGLAVTAPVEPITGDLA